VRGGPVLAFALLLLVLTVVVIGSVLALIGGGLPP
jgi:hypothetical protein